jgi:hypothetical protein
VVRVRRGWSGEDASGKWWKADVEVDSGDLPDILRTGDIQDWFEPMLSPTDRFRLLESEATRLLMALMISRHGDSPDLRLQLEKASREQGEVLERLKSGTRPPTSRSVDPARDLSGD